MILYSFKEYDMVTKELEVWADSFHEGQWCCENVADKMRDLGFNIQHSYINGFQPSFIMAKDDITIKFIVYGSYKSWNNRMGKTGFCYL